MCAVGRGGGRWRERGAEKLSGPELGTLLKGVLRLSALAFGTELTHTLKYLQVMARKKMGRGNTMPRMTRMEKTKSSTWGGEKQG